jgi:LPS O-antigen subunit length determinant protein (WzzB/FepE family)
MDTMDHEKSIKPSASDDDEISLIDLAATLLGYKKMILGVTVGAAVLAVLVAIVSLVLPREISYLPNLYTPKAAMLVSQDSGGLSSMLSSSGLGDSWQPHI